MDGAEGQRRRASRPDAALTPERAPVGSAPLRVAAPESGTPTPPSTDMGQMMQRIAEHSAFMETIPNRGVLAQEMLRHQKMLDQMLQLMQ